MNIEKIAENLLQTMEPSDVGALTVEECERWAPEQAANLQFRIRARLAVTVLWCREDESPVAWAYGCALAIETIKATARIHLDEWCGKRTDRSLSGLHRRIEYILTDNPEDIGVYGNIWGKR